MMPPPGYFIDTNLLTLFVAGRENPDLIARHRRLEGYSIADYALLRQLIGQVALVMVTPNTLTETSNLLSQHREPERSRLLQRLRAIIHDSREITVASAVAADNPAFARLGLTDAALLEVASADTPVVTIDFNLYRQIAMTKGPDAVVNFGHLQFRQA